MTRYKQTSDGIVAFTAEEEAERDAEEALWEAQQAKSEVAPSKEKLMAELAILTAKIQGL
jgi:hypothetical protein